MEPTALLLVLALAPPVPPPAAGVRASAAPAEARVVLESLDGEVREAALAGFTAEGRLDAVLVRFADTPEPAPLAPEGLARLELVGGDRLQAHVRGGAGEELQLELVGDVPLSVPIDAMSSLVFPGRLPGTLGSGIEPAREGDRLYRVTGGSGVLDRVDGAVEGFDADGVRFDSVLGTRTWPWSEVAALFVDPFATDTEAAADAQAVIVDLVDGSRLRGGFRGLDATGCRLATARGVELRLPVATLAEIAVDDGRLAFLSDLAPVRVEEGSPFGDDLGLVWPHRVDRAVDGSPLRAGGRRYTRGLGVHAPSRLTWDLGGAWTELRGSAALDDQVLRLAARGSVVFRVLVDGEERWASGVRRGGDPVLALPRVDLTGAAELTLEVGMASDLHMGDRADWLRVLLVRERG